jgi:hypothetical protein
MLAIDNPEFVVDAVGACDDADIASMDGEYVEG